MDTDNHLYGFQMGADGLLVARGPLEISAISKAGIYGNSANQHFVSDFSAHTIFCVIGRMGTKIAATHRLRTGG